MKILLFLFINSILLCGSRNINLYKKFLNLRKLDEGDTSDNNSLTEEIDSTYEENYSELPTIWDSTYNIPPQLLLFGFNRYQYNNTNKLIQFYTYIKIDGLATKDNISFPVTIKSNRRLRDLEEEEVNIIGINEGNIKDEKNVYFFNCKGEYNKIPSKVEFIKVKDFYINEIKYDLDLTSYAQYVSSNIQKQIVENKYLVQNPVIFQNSKIINQNKIITIEGEYNDNYSKKKKNAYLFKKGSDKHIPCTLENKTVTSNIYSLNCKPLSSFKDDLDDYLVNLTDINKLMFFDFKGSDSFVNYTIEKEKDSSNKISAGIIALIIIACIAVLAILGVMFYCMRKKNFQPPSTQSTDKNNNTLGVNQYNSSSNITN